MLLPSYFYLYGWQRFLDQFPNIIDGFSKRDVIIEFFFFGFCKFFERSLHQRFPDTITKNKYFPPRDFVRFSLI